MCDEIKLNIPGLSVEALTSLQENGITLSDISLFTEGDINDIAILKSFKDRFLIRQYLKQASDSICSSPIKPVASDKSRTHVEEHASVENQTQCQSVQYDAREMLSFKERRGKPTASQAYFMGLLRDSAKAARIWKKALPMCEISERKQEHFFETIVQACPQLRGYRRDVFRRLNAALNNRRKYLRDILNGKRKLHKTHNASAAWSEPAISSVKASSSSSSGQHSKLTEGENVQILSKRNKIIGKGTYLGQKGGFCEILVTYVSVDTLALLDEDLDLPAPCDGETVFSQSILKKIIMWRKDRISCTGGNPLKKSQQDIRSSMCAKPKGDNLKA
ncbi:uncharacterized protein [Argopecten irradians]|uniref:uncharacterized protein n=1 Tax=Argopecten irradians TaxID=31199 RepID=UPI00371DB118